MGNNEVIAGLLFQLDHLCIKYVYKISINALSTRQVNTAAHSCQGHIAWGIYCKRKLIMIHRNTDCETHGYMLIKTARIWKGICSYSNLSDRWNMLTRNNNKNKSKDFPFGFIIGINTMVDAQCLAWIRFPIVVWQWWVKYLILVRSHLIAIHLPMLSIHKSVQWHMNV